ncbi:MAG: hypothetical protein LRZ88_11620 [Candidatus Cloacimonetes bacterium]|nr:hypothetical protein [Candidatus Cloacimonadota bacterium]
MKLRKEKGQAPDSPLYQKFPIQPDILSSVLDSYSLLAMTRDAPASQITSHKL